MNRIPMILIYIIFCSNHLFAQETSVRKYEFSMQSAAGFSSYKKTFSGLFLSTDFNFPIYRGFGFFNSFTLANGKEKGILYRPNYQFANWNIGPEIQFPLFGITNFQIASGMSTSWFMYSRILGELEQNNFTYPLVTETATYNIGFFITTSYNIFITKKISIGFIYSINSMSKENGYMNNIGLACQIGLSK
jgi:hypothetical protein